MEVGQEEVLERELEWSQGREHSNTEGSRSSEWEGAWSISSNQMVSDLRCLDLRVLSSWW